MGRDKNNLDLKRSYNIEGELVSKLCKGCLKVLEVKSFNKNNVLKDGYSSKCKDCIRKDNGIKKREIIRKYDSDNKLIEKRCFNCKEFLSISNYKRNKESKDGFGGMCVDCYRKKVGIKKREIKRKYVNDELIEKRCFNCKEWLLIDNFYKSNDSNDGYVSECKECIRKNYGREKMSEIKFKIRNYRKVENINDKLDVVEKKCWRCNSWLDIAEFYNNRCMMDGKSGICKSCFRLYYGKKKNIG